jgi:hypothetical protein
MAFENIYLRVPPDIKRVVTAEADALGISVNQLIIRILYRRYLDEIGNKEWASWLEEGVGV